LDLHHCSIYLQDTTSNLLEYYGCGTVIPEVGLSWRWHPPTFSFSRAVPADGACERIWHWALGTVRYDKVGGTQVHNFQPKSVSLKALFRELINLRRFQFAALVGGWKPGIAGARRYSVTTVSPGSALC
jgi:hypothetical protein